MGNVENDEKGFTCECGLRNDFPSYVQAHWGVKLIYSCCSCQRQYILYRGTVTKTARGPQEVSDDEAFGD
jgi:hypothetical protein